MRRTFWGSMSVIRLDSLYPVPVEVALSFFPDQLSKGEVLIHLPQ